MTLLHKASDQPSGRQMKFSPEWIKISALPRAFTTCLKIHGLQDTKAPLVKQVGLLCNGAFVRRSGLAVPPN
jgi:hypothetical protein